MRKKVFILITIFGVVLFIFELPKRLEQLKYMENYGVNTINKQLVREETSYVKQLYTRSEEEQNWIEKIWSMVKSYLAGK